MARTQGNAKVKVHLSFNDEVIRQQLLDSLKHHSAAKPEIHQGKANLIVTDDLKRVKEGHPKNIILFTRPSAASLLGKVDDSIQCVTSAAELDAYFWARKNAA